jgi:hypothetical protein
MGIAGLWLMRDTLQEHFLYQFIANTQETRHSSEMKHLIVNATNGFVYMLIQFENSGVDLKNKCISNVQIYNVYAGRTY